MKIILFLIFTVSLLVSSQLPVDYYKIKNTKKMKQVFFKYIKELAQVENAKILKSRELIKKNYATNIKSLENIRLRYSIKADASLQEYLYSVDIVPISLILSQAAFESGWGKSRFFKQAKNIFGQWTWSGKGLDPLKRAANKKHKVKIFPTYAASVRSYLININKSWAYEELRTIRQKARQNGKNPNGYDLAAGLVNYSQKREEYVMGLQKFNKI